MDIIEKPDFKNMNYWHINDWFETYVRPQNKLIEGARVVYSNGLSLYWDTSRKGNHINKALIVSIEPIIKETCADVLVDFIKAWGVTNNLPTELDDRAKAAIKRENNGRM